MGFLDNDDEISISGSNDKLDLVDFENNFLRKFNDSGILNTKYKAEEFGLSFKKKEMESDVYQYEGGETITICSEPLEFIKEFDDVSDDMSKAEMLFLEKITTFKQIVLDEKPELKGNSTYGERMWMNKTLTGINLRPGNLNDDRDDFTPIRMCDDNVHGLIAGRTGSGKSVFINALILSLITEYSPWELNLYLADFKKVELSRYMNNSDDYNQRTPFTPHVNACAATSEIRYVKSLIKYLVDCMNARQEFFARLGVTKIQEFRNKYNIVLPRVLLIVDEFQQLFTEATNREKEEIQMMLNSITKLGRATGFHLVFASQEMSGTLRGNTLANFKIRMVLPCNQQISTDILGNGQGVNLERGYVLVNIDSGDELKNKKYRVPFIETDKKDDDDNTEKPPFYRFLDEIKLASKKYDLTYKTKTQKFYREEMQESESDYRNDLDRISEKKNKLVSQNKGIFDAIILGKTVLYSPRANDKVSFYIEKGRNKGIMIACPDADNASRVRKLLAENLLRSNAETFHFGMEMNNLILEKYHIDKVISKHYKNHKYYGCDIDKSIEYLMMMFYLRQYASKTIENTKTTLSEFALIEEKLIGLLNNSDKVLENKKNKEKKERLKKDIEELEIKISELNKDSKMKITNPIIRFFEKCSTEIDLNGTKADLIGLKLYKEIVTNFSANIDIDGAAKKSIEMLDKKISALSNNNLVNEEEKLQNSLAILRNKTFRRAIMYFVDKYNNRSPEVTKMSSILDGIYCNVQMAVEVYKKKCENKRSASDNTTVLLEQKDIKQDELAEVELNPDEIEIAEKKVLDYIKGFVTEIFDAAYTAVGYKKNKPDIPSVEYTFTDGLLNWRLSDGNISKEVSVIGNDILNKYIECCRKNKSACVFKKTVFWINGLDEIEKIPNQLVEVIRNSINQNILVIAIITSELKDSIVRKAFDYAFITGNIEKFYTMFNLKYTKQPLDSIVVNFGIRSKGLDIPFKMYKSNLEDIQAPNFVDQLLND